MSRRNSINRQIFDFSPMRFLGEIIYKTRRNQQVPTQSTATKFFRNLNQLTFLDSPLSPIQGKREIQVLVAGCSMGCEAYSLAGYLDHTFPDLDFHIYANDISEEALEVAKSGHYRREHGLGAGQDGLAGELEAKMFERKDDSWRIIDSLRSRVIFSCVDVLSPEFSRFKNLDLVLGQNFMIHMSEENEAQALSNLVKAAGPSGTLFVGGMNLDLKHKLVGTLDICPVDWNVEAIHNDDGMRRSAWPWHYWSLEPINRQSPNFLSRYSTIFTKMGNKS